jgi:hypothetical protein
MGGYGTPPIAASDPEVTPERRLPQAPPGVAKRSTDPWAHGNRSKTLLDIGAAFLSSDDFFRGLGNASSALSGRHEQLNKASIPQITYGGPDDQFEISTDPTTGERTIREVPEFAQAVAAKRASTRALSPKDQTDLRARAIYAIGQLPPEQRNAAYADLMNNPGRYGVDTTGLPPGWDETYGSVMGGIGQPVGAAQANADRDRAFDHRVTQDRIRNTQTERRLGQGDQRLTISRNKGSGGAKRNTFKASPGFILD